MNEISFSTKISEDGTIFLPNEMHLNGKTVQITIQLTDSNHKTEVNIDNLLKKWTGFLKISPIEEARYEYLMEK